jgi:type I restriction enzyme S subunit
MRPGYKQTPIGEIPEEWVIENLGNEEVVELVMGQSPPSSTYNDKGQGLPFFQGNADFGEIYPSPTLYCSKSIKIAEKNDVLISVRAPVGDINIIPYEGCIGRGVSAIRPKKERLDYRYLFYYLKYDRTHFERISMGSTFKAIRKNELESYSLPLPPLPEQKRIAEVLFTVDDAIQRVEEAITKTERLKQGLMQKLLTDGIGHTEFKDTAIGRIPKTWDVVKAKDLILELRNGFASGKRDDTGIVQIRMNNVTTDGRLIFDSYLKVPKPDNLEEWILKKGDLVFNNTNSYDLVGKSTIFFSAPFECTFSNHFTRIRFDKSKVIPELILNHLILLWRKGYFKSVAIRHVGQAAVHSKYVEEVTIPLPAVSEQKKIAEILSTVDRKRDLERERKGRLERIKKGLINDLLTGKKRVKIGG